MTQTDFVNTGRIIDLKTFSNLYPKEELQSDCTDVVLYQDGWYIQMLKSGWFFFNGYQHHTLEAMEKLLWIKFNEN